MWGAVFCPRGRNIDTRFCVWYNTYILFALHRTSGIPGETTVQTEQAVSLFVWKSSGSRAAQAAADELTYFVHLWDRKYVPRVYFFLPGTYKLL